MGSVITEPAQLDFGETISEPIDLKEPFGELNFTLKVPTPDPSALYELIFETSNDQGKTWEELYRAKGSCSMIGKDGKPIDSYYFNYSQFKGNEKKRVIYPVDQQYRTRLFLNKALVVGHEIGGKQPHELPADTIAIAAIADIGVIP